MKFNYVGTEEQCNEFVKSIVKEYIIENNMLLDDYDEQKTEKKTA